MKWRVMQFILHIVECVSTFNGFDVKWRLKNAIKTTSQKVAIENLGRELKKCKFYDSLNCSRANTWTDKTLFDVFMVFDVLGIYWLFDEEDLWILSTW